MDSVFRCRDLPLPLFAAVAEEWQGSERGFVLKVGWTRSCVNHFVTHGFVLFSGVCVFLPFGSGCGRGAPGGQERDGNGNGKALCSVI